MAVRPDDNVQTKLIKRRRKSAAITCRTGSSKRKVANKFDNNIVKLQNVIMAIKNTNKLTKEQRPGAEFTDAVEKLAKRDTAPDRCTDRNGPATTTGAPCPCRPISRMITSSRCK